MNLKEAKRLRRKRRILHKVARYHARRDKIHQVTAGINEEAVKMYFPNAKLNLWERIKLYVSQVFKK